MPKGVNHSLEPRPLLFLLPEAGTFSPGAKGPDCLEPPLWSRSRNILCRPPASCKVPRDLPQGLLWLAGGQGWRSSRVRFLWPKCWGPQVSLRPTGGTNEFEPRGNRGSQIIYANSCSQRPEELGKVRKAAPTYRRINEDSNSLTKTSGRGSAGHWAL